MIKKDFQFFLANKDALLKKYPGKYLLIHNEEVVGAFDSEVEAYQTGVEKFELGNFLIQPCMPGEDSYTQTFHSRVTFI